LFSYRCQASIAGGIGDTIVIQKVPVKNNYQFFCSQQDGVQVMIDIINRMSNNAANTKPNTLYGDFTTFDFPSIDAANSQLIAKMDALQPLALRKNMAAADLATSVTMMGIGLKNLIPFLKTNGSFDTYSAANRYAEPIVSLCDATRIGSLNCHYKSGSNWQQYLVRDQLNRLLAYPTIGGMAPPSAKYFGYVGDAKAINGSLDRSKMLEATYGKTIFNYLAKNIRNLISLRTGIVLAFVDASVKSGEPFTVTVKGLSGGQIVAVTSRGQTVNLEFKTNSFQFLTNASPRQSWIPVGMYTANPWPINDMGAYRTNMNTALGQAAVAGTYSAESSVVSDDSKKCTNSTVGKITVGGVEYKFKNSQLGGENFSNKTFPCRGLFKNSSGSYDFVGTMTVSCNNGSMSVSANKCGERVFASGMTGQSCGIENGVGTMMYKQLENGSFDPTQKSCQYISCLYGTEKISGTCVPLLPMIRTSYLLAFGMMPNTDQESWWAKEIKAKGLTMDQVMKGHEGWIKGSKWEREHTIARAYLKVFGIEPEQAEIDAMTALVFETDKNKTQVHVFSEMVTHLIKWSKKNEYLGRRSIVTRSYQEAFGVEPSAQEMANFNVAEWANTYDNIMLTHLKWIQGTDSSANNGRINLANRIYQKFYQRNATTEEQKYVVDLITKGLLYNKIRDRIFVKDLHTRIYGGAPGDSWYQTYQKPEETAQTIAHKFVAYAGFASKALAAGNDEQYVKWIYKALFAKDLTDAGLLNTGKDFLSRANNKMSRVELAHWMIEHTQFISQYRPTGIKTSFRRTYYGKDFSISDGSGVNPTEANASNDFSSWAVRESARGLLGRKSGHMAYGPYASDFPQRKPVRASFEMKITSDAKPDDVLFTIDLTINGGAVTIVKFDVKRKDFAKLNQYRKFNFDFVLAHHALPTSQVELRVHTKGVADITLYKVELTELESLRFDAQDPVLHKNPSVDVSTKCSGTLSDEDQGCLQVSEADGNAKYGYQIWSNNYNIPPGEYELDVVAKIDSATLTGKEEDKVLSLYAFDGTMYDQAKVWDAYGAGIGSRSFKRKDFSLLKYDPNSSPQLEKVNNKYVSLTTSVSWNALRKGHMLIIGVNNKLPDNVKANLKIQSIYLRPKNLTIWFHESAQVGRLATSETMMSQARYGAIASLYPWSSPSYSNPSILRTKYWIDGRYQELLKRKASDEEAGPWLATMLTGGFWKPMESIADIRGYVDSAVLDANTGNVKINGWACAKYLNQSIDVHLYVGGSAGNGGVIVSGVTANLDSEAAVATECEASGKKYRFVFDVNKISAAAISGKKIYVHGISPVGKANSTVANSGVLSMPNLGTAMGWSDSLIQYLWD
ncbi:MAG TPA: hypothetical protein PLU69_07735, partial [Acinetobacter sp.]|nr:hypothetical protein [Acinetobacter sp.]